MQPAVSSQQLKLNIWGDDGECRVAPPDVHTSAARLLGPGFLQIAALTKPTVLTWPLLAGQLIADPHAPAFRQAGFLLQEKSKDGDRQLFFTKVLVAVESIPAAGFPPKAIVSVAANSPSLSPTTLSACAASWVARPSTVSSTIFDLAVESATCSLAESMRAPAGLDAACYVPAAPVLESDLAQISMCSFW